MAKFITVNCGMEPILVNTDCSVMHFLLYLTNKHVQLQAGIYGLSTAWSINRSDCKITPPARESHVKESKSSTPESPKKGQAKMMNSPRGKGKKIDLEDCVTEYDIMDGDGCLIGPDLKNTP